MLFYFKERRDKDTTKILYITNFMPVTECDVLSFFCHSFPGYYPVCELNLIILNIQG